jgi:hypothetical protein
VEAGLPQIWERKEMEFYSYYDLDEFQCWKEWSILNRPIWEAPLDCFRENKSHSNNHRHFHEDPDKEMAISQNERKPLNLTILRVPLMLLVHSAWFNCFVLFMELVVSFCMRRKYNDRGHGSQFMQTGMTMENKKII